MSKSYLLILSCSARKYAVTGKVAAWDLYDGVAFRVVKRLQREGRFPDGVNMLILSAQHGLIEPSQPIAYYDQRMTQTTADKQAASNCSMLRELLCSNAYDEVFLNLGKTYFAALQPVEDWLPPCTKLTVAQGGIGCKLQQMKKWLMSKRRCIAVVRGGNKP